MPLNTKLVLTWWGSGLAPLHFFSKEFEILDLHPPINDTFQYGVCHFRHNFALKIKQHFYEKINQDKSEWGGRVRPLLVRLAVEKVPKKYVVSDHS